jgi:hypothetical protein
VTHDEPAQKFQPRSLFSTWIGVVLLFALFGLLALVVIGGLARGNSYEKKRARVRAEKLKAVNEAAFKALTTYAWVDKNKGVVRIPISHAIDLTMAELSQKTPAPANPIATPPPQNAAPTTASPAPSPTVNPSGTPKPTSITGPNSESRNQPAAAINPPPAPPGTQPGASKAPAASPPSATVKPPVSSSASPSPSAPATPVTSPQESAMSVLQHPKSLR